MIAVSTHSQTGTLALAVDTYPSATVWPNSHGTAILITFRARLLRAETKASVLSSITPSRNSLLPEWLLAAGPRAR